MDYFDHKRKCSKMQCLARACVIELYYDIELKYIKLISLIKTDFDDARTFYTCLKRCL